MESADQQENCNGVVSRACRWFKAFSWKSCAEAVKLAEKTMKLVKDDPRRIVHSFKFGLALTLVSLFYYFKTLFDGFGVNAMWAVLTVVVVFEFSVGATFGKGTNRMFATFTGGALGVGIHRLATLSGRTGEPILIAFFVFLISVIVTFMRFFPSLKARYDYGLTIFILTFCLISVSGYRDNEVLQMAHERLSTIIIGSCITIIVCICICPVWVGQDLHNLVADNMEKLGDFLEGFGGEYFKVSEDEKSNNEDKLFLREYKSVLNSKHSEETMANLAKWEPGHGLFKFRHPWKTYLKVGILTRQCAYKIQALHCYLNSDIQTSLEIRSKIEETCIEISIESSKALKELATVTRKMTRAKSANIHLANAKTAAENLKSLLKTNLWEEAVLLEILPVATVALLLVEVVECTEKVAGAVHELAVLAAFKSGDAAVSPELPHLLHKRTIDQSVSNTNVQNHQITVLE